jgi:septum formation protein
MREAGYDFEVVVTDADEMADSADPVGTVTHNALAKLAACRAIRPDADILTADTLVWFDGKLVGKPRDEEEAAAFLRAFSGRQQTVFTAVAFSRAGEVEPKVRVEASLVRFKELSEKEIADYIRVVHPLDRAGAYDAADYGELVIAEVVGSFTNVVGLPMETVRELV